MKKGILLLIVILGIGGLVFVLKERSDHVITPSINNETNQQQPEDKQVLTVATSSRTVAGDFYAIGFEFPVTNSDAINASVRSRVSTLIQDFEDEVNEFGPHPVAGRTYQMTASFEQHTAGQYVGFVFLVTVDTGGAHPNHYFETMVFDENEEQVYLQDVLEREFNGEEAITPIAVETQRQLNARFDDQAASGWIQDGASPQLENFSDFYVTKTDSEQTITFLFEPYAIGPYVWSSQEVTIPFAVILNN